MPSSRETNTMAEGLRRILNEITSMKTMPDGDLEFLVGLETEVLQYLRTPTSQAQASGMQGPSAQGGMGSPVAQYPSAPPGTPAGGGIGAPAIDPGELQRMIAGM